VVVRSLVVGVCCLGFVFAEGLLGFTIAVDSG
jgi:hypothetical protein